MSAFITITDHGIITATQEILKTVGDKRLGSWIRWAIGEQADEFVEFVQTRYLSGQKMKVRSGQTRDHIGAWLQKKVNGKKSFSFLIRPGVGIPGLQNYLERWTGTSREFMIPAWRDFGENARITRYVDMNLSKMLAKVQKEMDKG